MEKKLVFISHRHSDQKIAELLVEFLLAALKLENKEILCTSVPGHTLDFGKSISELLKDNLNTAAVLIALITTDSLQSSWVLFELGSSWAMGKLLIPILGPGITHDKLPGPLKTYPVVQIEEENASFLLREAINQIASNLKVSPKDPNARTDAKLKEFVDEFKVWKPELPAPPLGTSRRRSVLLGITAGLIVFGIFSAFLLNLLPGLYDSNPVPRKNPSSQGPETKNLPENNDNEKPIPIDYTLLGDLLGKRKWKEADAETTKVMLQAAGREKEGWLRVEDIDEFSCEDLRIIDELWRDKSGGKFGFSVQVKIYQNLYRGSKEATGKDFADRVGWRKEGQWVRDSQWTKIIVDQNAPEGQLPTILRRSNSFRVKTGENIRFLGWRLDALKTLNEACNI